MERRSPPEVLANMTKSPVDGDVGVVSVFLCTVPVAVVAAFTFSFSFSTIHNILSCNTTLGTIGL